MMVGWRVYGLGVIALAVVAFAIGSFLPGQPVPKAFPDRTALAYVAAAFMLVAGLSVEWRRTAAWAGAALAIYFGIVVVGMMDGRIIVAHYAEFGAYNGTSEQLATAMGGLILYASTADIDAVLAARLIRAGQAVFGICAILFGAAHFVYMDLTAPLVPSWLPPNQLFWGYATGVFHIAAGIAIITGFQARLAAILLTVMYALFTPLVHLPMLLATPAGHYIWSENAENIVLTGAAWVVADSLARRFTRADG